MLSACSGWVSAAYRNSEWIADSPALRVRALFPRSCSRWSRNPGIIDASSWSMPSREGGMRVQAVT